MKYISKLRPISPQALEGVQTNRVLEQTYTLTEDMKKTALFSIN